jgi:hypothetical protein
MILQSNLEERIAEKAKIETRDEEDISLELDFMVPKINVNLLTE